MFVRFSSATGYHYVVHCEGLWSTPSCSCALPKNNQSILWMPLFLRHIEGGVGEWGFGEGGEFSKNITSGVHFLPCERYM